jgi:hypothetical protein
MYEPVTRQNKLAIGRNIRILHEIIDDNDSITIDDERVKNIFQQIATLINDPANRTTKGGKKSKRNSSKRANKKRKTIKSKSKRKLRTRKY